MFERERESLYYCPYRDIKEPSNYPQLALFSSEALIIFELAMALASSFSTRFQRTMKCQSTIRRLASGQAQTAKERFKYPKGFLHNLPK